MIDAMHTSYNFTSLWRDCKQKVDRVVDNPRAPGNLDFMTRPLNVYYHELPQFVLPLVQLHRQLAFDFVVSFDIFTQKIYEMILLHHILLMLVSENIMLIYNPLFSSTPPRSLGN